MRPYSAKLWTNANAMLGEGTSSRLSGKSGGAIAGIQLQERNEFGIAPRRIPGGRGPWWQQYDLIGVASPGNARSL